MVAGTVVVGVFGLEGHGIAVIGEVPSGLPRPALPTPGDLARLLLPAVGVLLVGYTDFVLTARAFAGRDADRLDSNQELLALGAANLGSGVLHGFPVSSSASRTALGASAGGRTQLYSLVTLAAVVCVLLFLNPLLSAMPSTVLGAIVVFAACRLVDLPVSAAWRRSGAVNCCWPSPAWWACSSWASCTACWSPSRCRWPRC